MDVEQDFCRSTVPCVLFYTVDDFISANKFFIYNKNSFDFILRLQLSLKNTFIGININREFKELDFKLNTYFQVGYLGATFTYGIEKQITKFSRLNASIMVNSMAGVILNLQ